MGKKAAGGKRRAARREITKKTEYDHLKAHNDLKSLRKLDRIDSGHHKPAKRRRTPVPGTASRKAGDKTGARSR
jgi:hypothetical protein